MPGDRPNILIIMTDQQRADHMACAGHPVIQTPNMDRIAAEGMRFSHCCTTTPICMPARASFISGMYAHSHGMWTNVNHLPAAEESLFGRLQEAGYRTAHIGKSHYYEHYRAPGFPAVSQHLSDHQEYMRARGFDDVLETTGPWATLHTDSIMTDRWVELGLLAKFRNDYRARRDYDGIPVWPSPLPADEFMDAFIGRTAKEYLEQYDGERPFCTFVGFGGPHEPWDAPEPYASMYEPEQMPQAVEPGPPADWMPPKVAAFHEKARQGAMDPHIIAALRANYCGKISLIDHWIGEIRRVIEYRDWDRDTLVVFWSDHGEMAGDHQRLHKQTFLESSLRVPLMFSWPGQIEAGAVRDDLTCTVDIPTTILDLAGVEQGERMQGRSLAPVMDDPEAGHRDAVFSEINPGPTGNIMVRTRDWKYAMDLQGGSTMLYHLAEDPDEQQNLVGHPRHQVDEVRLRDEILRFLAGSQVQLQKEH